MEEYNTAQKTYPIRHDELRSNPPRRLLLCGQNPVYPHDRRGRQVFLLYSPVPFRQKSFRNFGILFLVPYTKDFGRITRF